MATFLKSCNLIFGKYVIPNSKCKKSKLAPSLQYLQKEMSDEVDIFCSDKH